MENESQDVNCSAMTFNNFLQLFDGSSDNLAEYLVENEISLERISDFREYPNIAKELVSKGKLDPKVCQLMSS